MLMFLLATLRYLLNEMCFSVLYWNPCLQIIIIHYYRSFLHKVMQRSKKDSQLHLLWTPRKLQNLRHNAVL